MLQAHDPTLAAAAAVADRQAHHVAAADAFVDAHLSRLDAFSGVLSVFRDEYAQALGHVHDGMGASASRARLLRDALLRCREEYAAADGLARHDLERLRRGLGDVRLDAPDGVVGEAPAVPAPSERDSTGLRDALKELKTEDEPADEAPTKDEVDGRTRGVRDRDGSLIDNPGQTLLDEAGGVRDSVVELRDGLADIGESVEDVQDYRDFVAAP